MVEPKQRAAPEDLALAVEFAGRLAARLGSREFEVRLFGSRARGQADEESDLDLFVALARDDPDERVKGVALEIARDLTLERGVLVSVFVADHDFVERHRGFSFLETVNDEGVPV